MENYSATLTEMIEAQDNKKSGDSQQVAELQAQVTALKQDKAQVEVDLNKTEVAFSDLHRKYEKLKEVLGACIAQWRADVTYSTVQRTTGRTRPSSRRHWSNAIRPCSSLRRLDRAFHLAWVQPS